MVSNTEIPKAEDLVVHPGEDPRFAEVEQMGRDFYAKCLELAAESGMAVPGTEKIMAAHFALTALVNAAAFTDGGDVFVLLGACMGSMGAMHREKDVPELFEIAMDQAVTSLEEARLRHAVLNATAAGHA